MARFYADIQGNRGPATRMGSANSGIGGHVRGWNVGVRVAGVADGDEDAFLLYATSGSNGGGNDRFLGQVVLDEDGNPVFRPAIGVPVEVAR